MQYEVDGFIVGYDPSSVKKNLSEAELAIMERVLPEAFIETEDETVIKEELVNLYSDAHNPNKDIFVVPTQEGADKDDQWNGSIGDATMEHLSHMLHKSPEMEHFIHTPNGNIFRAEQNVSFTDNAIKKQNDRDIIAVLTASTELQSHDLSKMVLTPTDEPAREWRASRASYRSQATAPLRVCTVADKEAVVMFLREELALQEAAKQEKADALDWATVNFGEWEAFPQLTKSIDIPSTPTPLYIYAGNSSQMFYDNIPEDHPDLRIINTFLSMSNSIDWDHFTKETLDFFVMWLNTQDIVVPYVKDRLVELANDIYSVEKITPDASAKKALDDIENNWREIVFAKVRLANKDNVILQEIVEFEKTLVLSGNGNLHWGKIGKFGQSLFKRHSTNMSAAHWIRYKEMKKRFAPEVKIGKLNVNKANFNDLRDVFKKSYKNKINHLIANFKTDAEYVLEMDKIKKDIENRAARVYHMLPVMSLQDLMNMNIFTVDDIGSTVNTVLMISDLKRAMKDAIATRQLKKVTSQASAIVAAQQVNPKACSQEEWAAVWQVYHICKSNVCAKLGIEEIKPQRTSYNTLK